MEIESLDMLAHEVKEMISRDKQAMALGQFPDYAAYREAVGRISRAEQILSYMREIEKKIIEQ